jgi:hypothetical protein
MHVPERRRRAVSTHSNDPVGGVAEAGEVPEADRLEQLAAVDEEPADPEAPATARTTTDELEANEADVLEQMASVNEDEDYPRGEEPE